MAIIALCLAICDSSPSETKCPPKQKGSHKLPGLDRDALILYRIYERFIANFYKLHLVEWGSSTADAAKMAY